MIDDSIYIKPSAPALAFYRNLGDFFIKPFDQHYAPLNFLFQTGCFNVFQKPFALYLISLLLFYAGCVLLFVLFT